MSFLHCLPVKQSFGHIYLTRFVTMRQARMQEMKEKEMKSQANGDANSHICKVCFESPTAAILLPCRHFCCKSQLHLHETSFLRTNYKVKRYFFVQYVNPVPWLALNAQSAAQRSLIGSLRFRLDLCKSKVPFCKRMQNVVVLHSILGSFFRYRKCS